MRISDWSSDVCSSDLGHAPVPIWIAGNEDLGKDDQLGAVAGGLGDEAACLGDRGVAIEEERAGLNGCRLEPWHSVHRRSEERRVGKGGVSKCRSWWSPLH